MKRTIIYSLILQLLLFSTNISSAYNITEKDTEIIQIFKAKTDQINKNESFIKIQEKIDEALKNSSGSERVNYILNKFKEYINQKTSSAISGDTKNILEIYGSGLDQKISAKCLQYYEEADDIAKKKDFPTALILAMRYKEHHCFYDNPPNGHGLFQLFSKDYGTGIVNEEIFGNQVSDFIDFSRGKIEQYNKNKRYGKEIKIGYDNFDADSIQIYSYVFNGVKKDYTPRTSKFVNGNLTSELSFTEDGVFTVFLKILKRKNNINQ